VVVRPAVVVVGGRADGRVGDEERLGLVELRKLAAAVGRGVFGVALEEVDGACFLVVRTSTAEEEEGDDEGGYECQSATDDTAYDSTCVASVAEIHASFFN